MRWLAGIAAALLLAFDACAAALPATVTQALKQAGIPLSSVAIEVREAHAHRPLLNLNADRPMNPASTMKLLTTYAALDMLGPAYSWKTEAWLDGELKDGVLHGNLVLKGYGDPKFTLEQFWLWLRELRARGLHEIRGDLVLDRSFFELPPHDPAAFDNDPVRAYNVGPDALLLNFNTLRLRYLPNGNGMKVISEPPLEGVKLDNRLAPQSAPKASRNGCDNWDDGVLVQPDGDSVVLQGGYPGECGEREQHLSVMPHTRYVEAVFRALWQELGGALKGKQREGVAGGNAQLFSTHHSEPLSAVIRDINKFSNNVMARQLFLTLGAAAQEGATSTNLERSTRTVQGWLQKQQLDFPELALENGAGLSRSERISAAHLAQLLQHAAAHPYSAEFAASLPILGVDGSVKKRLRESAAASHAHLKTGTLEGVKTIAGYVRSQGGREWVVVFLINHPNAKYGQAAQDALVEWVQGQ
ncbi:D-alanyl-D-alanine carboxypeptidase/D-alanyl-D-alanine endopeptidase [Candidatus Ferrigenium straubiae]|jgi:D-alanyl-D-alanine carboxypeptidase/D-alanyl-D-alanine-endopeptidase (penicillin-binding protein 4)|uniref:D-alanyl-D-alanine carboxypeptidase/D-alanyl-D-alanine endopeptidase n=1 Tax=Candidatus Ferrigenium straubiae TaxID=2919506 RepID=UPI003F4A9CA9